MKPKTMSGVLSGALVRLMDKADRITDSVSVGLQRGKTDQSECCARSVARVTLDDRPRIMTIAAMRASSPAVAIHLSRPPSSSCDAAWRANEGWDAAGRR
jgi:hypothetical protein